MDDDQFFRELTALDAGIANRWKTASGGKLAATIEPRHVLDILRPLFDAGKITANQAKALALMWTWSWEKFTPEARAVLFVNIEDAYTFDLFFKGSAVQLASAAQLSAVNAAIGQAAGVISFISPPMDDGTGIAYTADRYTAIKRLIADDKIKVFEVDAGALHAKAGLYRSDIDRLMIYKGLAPVLTTWTIIHEVTHAIQDWRDVVVDHEYAEADAYIAAAAAALAVGQSTLDAMAEYPAQKDAAHIVLDKKATPKNGAWLNAYAAVVRAVRKDPVYRDVIGHRMRNKFGESGKNERKILDDLLKDIKASRTAPPPALSKSQQAQMRRL
jgi:hypothetical protein